MKRWVTAGVALAVGAYASYVGLTWYRYGVALAAWFVTAAGLLRELVARRA